MNSNGAKTVADEFEAVTVIHNMADDLRRNPSDTSPFPLTREEIIEISDYIHKLEQTAWNLTTALQITAGNEMGLDTTRTSH